MERQLSDVLRFTQYRYVGNQGFKGKGYGFDVLKDDDWDDMLATNLNGVKNCVRAEINNMKGHGSIVNVRTPKSRSPSFPLSYSLAALAQDMSQIATAFGHGYTGSF